MTSSTRSEWLIPAGLIALSVIPVAAGTVRLVQLGGGAEITPDNARFFAAPLPVVLHIISASLYCIMGAFQFAPRLPPPQTQLAPRCRSDSGPLWAYRRALGLVVDPLLSARRW